MVDISLLLENKLKTVLPTYYELFLDKSASIPCISYQIINNAETELGNTLGYSNISVRVKLWARSMTDIVQYSSLIDDAMSSLSQDINKVGRFIRTSTNELENSGLICRILDYQTLIKEKYNEIRG